jgi:hypothetical protein
MTPEEFEAMVEKAASANVALFRRKLAEAIDEEREACARTVEGCDRDAKRYEIADAIRARGTESVVKV